MPKLVAKTCLKKQGFKLEKNGKIIALDDSAPATVLLARAFFRFGAIDGSLLGVINVIPTVLLDFIHNIVLTRSAAELFDATTIAMLSMLRSVEFSLPPQPRLRRSLAQQLNQNLVDLTRREMRRRQRPASRDRRYQQVGISLEL